MQYLWGKQVISEKIRKHSLRAIGEIIGKREGCELLVDEIRTVSKVPSYQASQEAYLIIFFALHDYGRLDEIEKILQYMIEEEEFKGNAETAEQLKVHLQALYQEKLAALL